ncbi:FecR family protein [Chitinophaga arvensicola]|uniref:FecR protein n=1 Tax=Chitinophaga arvensicola TaxID=29529 RepID=A0A1I0PM59_9BACT|nr:FecR family protein [Chitinophaga arvensicola]SEW15341.1 FecR protein [Chitinophaga arvensicola]
MDQESLAGIFSILKKKRENPDNDEALTPEEQVALSVWLEDVHNLQWYEEYILNKEGAMNALFLQTLDAEENTRKRLKGFTRSRKSSMIRRLSYAAAAAVVAGLVFVSILNRQSVRDKYTSLPASGAMQPGKDRAYLTLADGSIVDLDTATGAAIARQKGAVISNRGGEVTYNGTGIHENEFNSISIPNGGQYRLQLQDGSKIWLNAATTLRFPVQFGEVERSVELDGEAYFEITKDRRPFRVKYQSQNGRNFTVNVLGTHFVVSAYKDNTTAATTLVEGRVSLGIAGKDVLLSPGQQATTVSGSDRIDLKTVDTDAAKGWVTGSFYFIDSDLRTILSSIGRWYNVPVLYEKDYAGELFSCKLSRSAPLDSVLVSLRQFDVKADVINNKIVIR